MSLENKNRDENDTKSVSASNDFYSYVNKKWLDDPVNSIPDDYSSWGGFTKLYDEGLKNQISMVKDLTCKEYKSLNPEQQKITSIWNASSRRFDNWSKNKADYMPIINEISILNKLLYSNILVNHKSAHLNNVANYLHYSQETGIGNVLDFDKGSDLLVTNNVVLDISTCGLSLPTREYYLEESYSKKLDMFRSHLNNVKRIIEDNTNIVLDSNFVDNVINFETKIAEYTMKPEQSRRYDEYYTNTDLVGLYKDINNIRTLDSKYDNYKDNKHFLLSSEEIASTEVFFEKLYELFNFRSILKRNITKNFDDTDESKPKTEHITAYDGDAIRRCLHLIFEPANLNKYICFLTYKIIKSFYSVTSKELDNEFFDFYQRKMNGQKKENPEDKRTIGVVNQLAGEMMGKIYVEKYFSEEDKCNIETMIEGVLSIMKESLENNDWLTEPTKKQAIHKLSKFSYKIGYPEKWKDYSKLNINSDMSLYQIYKESKRWRLQVEFYDKINSKVNKDEWHMTPQTVNAYYSPTLNEIVFPAAILQPPFYHKSIDTINKDLDLGSDIDGINPQLVILASNLGGIGAVIAHEITHGFDDQGRKFDSEGNLNNWWTEDDIKLFNLKCDKVKNIAKDYKYVSSENSDKTVEHSMNPDLTMGENLADLGGLSLAKKVLKSKIISEKLNEEALFRIFFKSWANIWKLNIKQDRKLMLLSCDPHAPCDFRGNLVKNCDEFYKAFDVKPGDNMYLAETERLYMW